MRDPTEATVLVTGATDGLGRRVALKLAGRGAEVLLHGRRRERCEAVVEQVRRQKGAEGLRVRFKTRPCRAAGVGPSIVKRS